MSVSVVDNKIPVQIHQGKAKDDKQQLQLISTNPKERAINLSDPTLNPGEKGLNSPDLILLLKTQVPKLPVTLHQEVPGAGSDQIAKLNLHETSVHSRFQEQFATFNINKFSKFAGNFATDLYLSAVDDTYPPSTLIQPALKPT